jgi:predicted TIM-barrel fold metal-dependent hydrolase
VIKQETIVNVGSHANPPAEMWAQYFPRELRHKAPARAIQHFPGEGDYEVLVLEGIAHRQLGPQLGLTAPSGTVGHAVGGVPFSHTFTEGDAGQREPAARIAAQNLDGVAADVILHPGWPVLKPQDREIRWGMMYAFNTWLAEFCSYDPRRLIGIGEIPVWDVERAVEECKRIAKLGLKGVLMPAIPGYEGAWSCPADAAYYDPRYRPLWAALNDIGLVMVVHADAAAATAGLQDYSNNTINLIINKTLPGEMIATLIVKNIFHEFPDLKLVCVETGVGWMAHLVSWMEVLVKGHPHMYTSLKASPAETFHRHVYGSFLWDTMGVLTRDIIGVDNIMWCNDYPHNYGPWPHSIGQINKDLRGISSEHRQKILGGNAVRVFGL